MSYSLRARETLYALGSRWGSRRCLPGAIRLNALEFTGRPTVGRQAQVEPKSLRSVTS